MPRPMRMTETPVSSSPARRAAVTGDAPRYFGSREAWTFTQQGEVAVDAAVPRHVEDVVLQELPERDDGDDVRLLRAQPGDGLRRVDVLRRDAFDDAARARVLPARTRREVAAPRRTVRLRDDADHLETGKPENRA